MNLKEQLLEKQNALVALKGRIEAGDAEAIASSETLVAEINTLENQIKSANAAMAALGRLGTPEKGGEAKAKDGILGLNLLQLKDGRGSLRTQYKAVSNTDVITGTQEGQTDRRVVDVHPALSVRSLFGAESISGNALSYFRLGTMTGSPAVTAEGAKKPQINIGYEKITVALTKIAAFFKESDELLADNPYLESAIRNRGIYELNKVIESNLITTLSAVSGVQTSEDGVTFDSILKAKQAIRAATGYAPDALIINPSDLEALLKSKDTNNQYLLGGPASGSYGNGGYNPNPRIWGLNVVESAEITAGTVIVGAFRAGASVVTKSGEGMWVEVANTDVDDFEKNLITVRMEERLLLATRVPNAFYKLTTKA